MTDRLTNLFEVAASSIAAPPPDPASVMKRGSRRRLARLAVSGAATLAVTIAGVLGGIWLLGPKPTDVSGTGNGYLFTFEILGYDPTQNHVELRYTSEWETNEYPGSRACPWTFYREDGSVISESVHQIGAQLRRTVTHVTEVTVPEEPASVSARCGPRLDRGRFTVEDESERIKKIEKFIQRGYPGWAVIFDIQWHGGRRFGTADCEWKIYASATRGRLLSRGGMSYSGPSRTVKHPLRADFKEDPTAVEVECRTL